MHFLYISLQVKQYSMKIWWSFFAFLLILFTSKPLQAGIRHDEYGLRVGASFGAPMGPILVGQKGSPGILPSAGIYYEKKFNPKWGLMMEANYLGLNLGFEAPYANFYGDGTVIRTDPNTGETIVEEINDFYIYYALVKNGTIRSSYINFPVSAVYHLRRGWSFNFGANVGVLLKSVLTGDAVDVYLGEQGQGGKVDFYDFNESDEFTKMQWGVNTGFKYQLKMGINFDVKLNTELSPYFKKSFDVMPGLYRSMYIQTTIGYRLGGGKGFE